MALNMDDDPLANEIDRLWSEIAAISFEVPFDNRPFDNLVKIADLKSKELASHILQTLQEFLRLDKDCSSVNKNLSKIPKSQIPENIKKVWDSLYDHLVKLRFHIAPGLKRRGFDYYGMQRHFATYPEKEDKVSLKILSNQYAKISEIVKQLDKQLKEMDENLDILRKFVSPENTSNPPGT